MTSPISCAPPGSGASAAGASQEFPSPLERRRSGGSGGSGRMRRASNVCSYTRAEESRKRTGSTRSSAEYSRPAMSKREPTTEELRRAQQERATEEHEAIADLASPRTEERQHRRRAAKSAYLEQAGRTRALGAGPRPLEPLPRWQRSASPRWPAAGHRRLRRRPAASPATPTADAVSDRADGPTSCAPATSRPPPSDSRSPASSRTAPRCSSSRTGGRSRRSTSPSPAGPADRREETRARYTIATFVLTERPRPWAGAARASARSGQDRLRDPGRAHQGNGGAVVDTERHRARRAPRPVI